MANTVGTSAQWLKAINDSKVQLPPENEWYVDDETDAETFENYDVTIDGWEVTRDDAESDSASVKVSNGMRRSVTGNWRVKKNAVSAEVIHMSTRGVSG